MDNFIAHEALNVQLQSVMTSLADYTDVTGTVTIITVDFAESKTIDETTIPGDTATFAAKVSSAIPVFIETPESGGFSIVWPDPAGGWNFTSLQASPSGFAYGYRVDGTAGEFVGCKRFPQAVPIGGVGEHVLIGEIRLPVDVRNVFDVGVAPG